VRAFCEQVVQRDWNNLWQINRVCNACFRPQATIIGSCYVVILTSPNPLHELFRYPTLEEWVVVVDFDEQIHADLGGSFDLFLLTTTTLECKQYQAFYPEYPK
jgi:hypothetical protein